MKKNDYYIWVADIHGLESIVPFSHNILSCIELRSRSNPQRHYSYGTVCIPEILVDYLKKIDSKKGWILLGGTKEEKIPIVLEMTEKNEDQKVIDVICDGFEITCIPSCIKIIGQYTRWFKDDYLQNFV